jgi:hypothetical protein
VSWVLVLRNTKTGKCRIWRAKAANGVMRKLRDYFNRENSCWTKKADTLLLEGYRKEGPTALVGPVSKLLRRTVTKSAVVGRHDRLQRRKKRGTGNGTSTHPP